MSRLRSGVLVSDSVAARAGAQSLCSSALPGGRLQAADATALRLRMAAEALLLPLARVAGKLVRRKAWTPFGHARLDDYARERLDRSGRWVRDLAALDDGVHRMPELAAAVTGDDGRAPIGRVAAVLVSRVATGETVGAWIRLARESTVRRLRAAVVRARAEGSPWPPGGEPPGDRASGCGETTDRSTQIEDRDETEEQTVIRIPVPPQIKAAYDETLDLHRAVSGNAATVASFVEALVAEAYAGPHPPDADAVPVQAGPDEARLEEILSRSSDLWAHLQPAVGLGDPLAGAGGIADESGIEAADLESRLSDALEGTDPRTSRGDVAVPSDNGRGPRELDRRLRALIDLESGLQRQLGQVLAELGERGAWSTLMFRGVGHYAEQRLGLGRSAAADRVRLHRGLRRFPLLREAYGRGHVGLEASLSIVRLLGTGPSDPVVEKAWVERARRATVKRLRDETRYLGRLKLGDPHEPHSIAPLDDAEWQATLRRDPGMAAGRVRALGKAIVPREDTSLRRGGCFGHPDVFLRLRLPADLADAFLVTVESRRRDLTRRVESVPWDEPWPDPDAPPSVRAARTFSGRAHRVPSWVALLALLEDYVDTWDDPASMPRRKADRIYRRDGWRCTAPGCSSRENLEEHHVMYRSHGGNHDECNRTCLCRFHHQRGEHGGLASCRGKAPLDIVWRLGRRDLATHYRNELRIPDADAGL